jgi:hypothetical protein
MDDRRVYRATTPSGRAVYQDHAPTEDQLLWRWVEYAPAAALDAKDAEIAAFRWALAEAQYGLSWALANLKERGLMDCPPVARGLEAARAALSATTKE